MEAVAGESDAQRGKLGQLSSGEWYLHCKWCSRKFRSEAHVTEDEAIGMLSKWPKWRESMTKNHEGGDR